MLCCAGSKIGADGAAGSAPASVEPAAASGVGVIVGRMSAPASPSVDDAVGGSAASSLLSSAALSSTVLSSVLLSSVVFSSALPSPSAGGAWSGGIVADTAAAAVGSAASAVSLAAVLEQAASSANMTSIIMAAAPNRVILRCMSNLSFALRFDLGPMVMRLPIGIRVIELVIVHRRVYNLAL